MPATYLELSKPFIDNKNYKMFVIFIFITPYPIG